MTGSAAVLAQRHPDWTADELMHQIIGTLAPVEGDGYNVGAGRVDIGAGVTATLLADRDELDVPLAHPQTETLTWTNIGQEPETVTVGAELEDRRGEPVDEVTVEPGELTVAPGTTATATVAIDGADLEPGLYSGAVTATADDESLRTPRWHRSCSSPSSTSTTSPSSTSSAASMRKEAPSPCPCPPTATQ